MRSIRLGIVTATAGVAAALGCAASAQAQDPTPVNTKYFFQCADGVKVRNGASPAPWSTTAPAFSFLSGAGCGALDVKAGGMVPDTVHDAVFEGTHHGPATSLTVRLYDLLLSQGEALVVGEVRFVVRLQIDGVTVLDTAGTPYADAPTISSTGLTQWIEFSVTNLGVDDGDHTYRLAIDRAYTDTAAAWVWGASEIPSSIEFNPVRNASPRIPANS